MIHSMTAYASAKTETSAVSVTLEIRSVNSRYLDVALKLPQTRGVLEENIRSRIADRLTRGRIEVRAVIAWEQDPGAAWEIDTDRADGLARVLADLERRYDRQIPLTLDWLSGPGEVLRAETREIDAETLWPQVAACLDRALEDLVAMRKTEGEHIARDMDQRLSLLEGSLEEIRQGADDLVEVYRQRLNERIAALTRGLVEIDPARLAQEAAFLADRSDISEEIVRAESHIRQFRKIMASDAPAGKKLNFLLQEFNREFNTMGSKASSAAIAHTIVTAKSEIEKIREQVQNIE